MTRQADSANLLHCGLDRRRHSLIAWFAVLVPCIVVVANIFDSTESLRPSRFDISIEWVTFGGMTLGTLLTLWAVSDALIRRRRLLLPIVAAAANGTLIGIAAGMIAYMGKQLAAQGK